ncbi:MAG TPA: hypothetical protein VFA65_08155 [Bryobacteraceae bacterium]|nr:hypothetical protein [Bryobacteraceae bacterium]
MADQGINGPNDPNNPGLELDDAMEPAVIPGADGAAMAPEVEDETESDDPPASGK